MLLFVHFHLNMTVCTKIFQVEHTMQETSFFLKKKKKSVDFACGIFSNDLLFQSSLPAEKNLVDIPLSV